MIENFGVKNPCHRCAVRGVCEATEKDCFDFKNYMALFRAETSNNPIMPKDRIITDKAYSVPFILDVSYNISEDSSCYITRIKWSDNTETEYSHSLKYDQVDGPRLGMSMCIMKKLYGPDMCDNLLNNLYKETIINGKEKTE